MEVEVLLNRPGFYPSRITPELVLQLMERISMLEKQVKKLEGDVLFERELRSSKTKSPDHRIAILERKLLTATRKNRLVLRENKRLIKENKDIKNKFARLEEENFNLKAEIKKLKTADQRPRRMKKAKATRLRLE